MLDGAESMLTGFERSTGLPQGFRKNQGRQSRESWEEARAIQRQNPWKTLSRPSRNPVGGMTQRGNPHGPGRDAAGLWLSSAGDCSLSWSDIPLMIPITDSPVHLRAP
jgi:hypothetical protein